MTKFLYIGQRLTSKGNKLVHAFVEPSQPLDASAFTYWPKAKAAAFYGAVIGKIYDFGDEDRLPHLWSEAECDQVEPEKRLQLQAESKAEALKKRETNKEPDPELQALIKRLADARRKVPYNQRLNFDVWVLNNIR